MTFYSGVQHMLSVLEVVGKGSLSKENSMCRTAKFICLPITIFKIKVSVATAQNFGSQASKAL